MEQLQIIERAESLEALNKSEIMSQVEVAKKYPRQISQVLNDVRTLATTNREIAGACFYSLPRGGKKIEGPSVRLAEIIHTSWGNLRAAARIISIDSTTLTAQGVCHDLQSNTAVSVEVQVRITKKDGTRYNDDMITVAGNAACSKAFRNAIFKAVPMALFHDTIQDIKKVIAGSQRDMVQNRAAALQFFQEKGVKEKDICKALGVRKVNDIDMEGITTLIGCATAVKDGHSTIEQIFYEGGLSDYSHIVEPEPEVEEEEPKKDSE